MILKPICKSNYLGLGREKEEGLQNRLPKGNLSTNHATESKWVFNGWCTSGWLVNMINPCTSLLGSHNSSIGQSPSSVFTIHYEPPCNKEKGSRSLHDIIIGPPNVPT